MRLSKKCEYAFRALFAVARRPERQFSIGEVSRHEGIPIKFLEQILLGLRHAGILSSKRGVGGGYQLRRPPEAITVGEVIRAMDGPPAAPPTAADARGAFGTLLRELHEETNAILESRTLGDILARAPEEAGATLSFEI